MDFIERWWGISPDGGNGTLEFLWVIGAAAGLVLLIYCRRGLRVGRHRPLLRD